MSIAEEYKESIKAYRTIFHYQEEVEKVAYEAFLAFNEEEKTYFGELLARIYGRNSRIYDTLHTNYEAIKANKRRLSRSEMHYLVSIILPCLPAVLQYECLQYEVLHTIQKQRSTLNHEGFRQVSVDKAFKIYNQYLESILHLRKIPSQWFHAESYTEGDRQEIIKSVQYVLVQKIKTSINRFTEDLRTLTQHYKTFTEDTVYFIELLAIEVSLSHKNWSSVQNITDDIEQPLPTPAGKFASFLKAYLVKELDNDNTQNSLQTIQNSILAHDIATALKQYKSKGFWRRKAKISFLLQGGAGILKMGTTKAKGWFDKLNVRERIFIGLMGVVYFIPAMIWVSEIITAIMRLNLQYFLNLVTYFFPTILLLGFFTLILYVGYFFIYEFLAGIIYIIDAPDAVIEADQDQRIANKILIDDYNKLVAKRRDEHFESQADSLNTKLYNDVLANLHEQAQIKLHKYYAGYVQLQFSNYLGIYRKMSEFILALSVKDLPASLLVDVSYQEKYLLLKAVQNILIHRLFRSFCYFLEVGKHTLNQNVPIIFYANFLDLDLSVQGEARCINKCKAQIAKITKHFEEHLPAFDVSMHSPDLQTWFEKEKKLLQSYHFENEVIQIKHQISLQKEANRNKSFAIIPLILETDEGILYV